MIYLDTESLGFFGPTLLIQYAEDNNDVILHNIFESTVGDTLNLIEKIVTNKGGICGFNLVHDWFHLSKTYGILKCLPHNEKVNPLDYRDVENSDEAHDKYCIKPQTALDLLLVGKRSRFQSVMNHRDITIRKVPIAIAEQLVNELLDNIHVPDIYFARSTMGYRWQIIDLVRGKGDELTPDARKNGVLPDTIFCNIRLRFNPSGSLKAIMKSLGHEVTELSELNEMDSLPRVSSDCGWWPCNGKWIDSYRFHASAWKNNTRRLEYARNDVKWLRILRAELGNPIAGDTDSLLACAVGAMYWKGFAIDRKTTLHRYQHSKHIINECPVNVSSPAQVKVWLSSVASPMERVLLKDTRSKTLRMIADKWVTSNIALATRCRQVIDARQAKNEAQMLARILVADRAYFLNKIVGTKSNRMSGGSERYIKSNGSINSQGIRKGDGTRSCFTLAKAPLVLCGGDFDGFEVSIAEAVYNDIGLRRDLLSGKKVHGLFGAAMYNKSYDNIMATAHINKEDDNGLYSRAKTGFFGTLYGAQENKLAAELRITIEEARAGLKRFFIQYPGVKSAQQRITDKLTCMYQPEIGGKVEWKEPQRFVGSLLGFRRQFDLEFSIIQALFNMASHPSDNLIELGKSSGMVVRRDRNQSVLGATISSLYAIAFSLGASIIRAGINHEIQSPGGEITKELQALIWTVQPCGVSDWIVMPMNVHDEIECPTHPNAILQVTHLVNQRIEELKSLIPLIKMDWKTNLKSWGEK
jgi:hypothetical protein